MYSQRNEGKRTGVNHSVLQISFLFLQVPRSGTFGSPQGSPFWVCSCPYTSCQGTHRNLNGSKGREGTNIKSSYWYLARPLRYRILSFPDELCRTRNKVREDPLHCRTLSHLETRREGTFVLQEVSKRVTQRIWDSIY